MNTSVIAAAVLLIAAILLWLILSYRGFVKLKTSSEEAFETAEVYLKQRRHLAGKLIRSAENCGNCDPQLLEESESAKMAAEEAESMEEKVEAENQLSLLLGEIFRQTHDEEKNSKAFLSLQNQVLSEEDRIANFARFYNALVKMLNTRVRSLPSNLIAKLFHFTQKPMLDMEIGGERKAV